MAQFKKKKESKLRKKERKKKLSGSIFSKTLNALATCQVIPKVQIYLTKKVVMAHFDGFILKFIQRLQIDHWQEVWIPHTRVKAKLIKQFVIVNYDSRVVI